MSTQPISRGATPVPLIPLDHAIEQSTPGELASIEEEISVAISAPPASVETGQRLRDVGPAMLPAVQLDSEISVYEDYSWCLNAFPTLQEVVGHLRAELKKLGRTTGWQYSEVTANIFLLSCAITDTIDDYFLGSTFDFSKLVRLVPIAGPAVRLVHGLLEWRSRLRLALLFKLRMWRNTWAEAVTDFVQHAMVSSPDRGAVLQQRDRLALLLPRHFDGSLGSRRPKIPAFFRSRDFAPPDCFELARKFIAEFPQSNRPTVIVGLRTAGSFLAPLVCAYLRHNRREATWIAIRPGKGLSAPEREALEVASRRKSHVVIADESIHSGQTLVKCIDQIGNLGFTREDFVVLNPVEPALPDWKVSRLCQSLSGVHIVTLEPKERHKYRLLESRPAVKERLNEYFQARGYTDVQLMSDPETVRLNRLWQDEPPARVDFRLKRVYKVSLQAPSGAHEVRYVIAKSVGWGWLAYHAFFVGRRLAQWVPPMLGVRDGILYSEWLPQGENGAEQSINREETIRCLASYVAARSKHLRCGGDPVPELVREDRHKGFELLASCLSRAYNSRIVAAAKRPQLRRELAQQNDFSPVMTDSKMFSDEWIHAGNKLTKVDGEHHSFGKNELCITDPAFDLASAIFHFELSEEESERLVSYYVAESGDTNVERRLFLNKLLASVRVQSLADHDLHHARLFPQRGAANRQYISAWNFLVRESVRECGKRCVRPEKIHWHAPLVVADIDGVLDRMVFGFPCTTVAGIKAISLLHAHGYCIALNTARTVDEVKEYCRSYGFAGGVAEYGAILWDAISNKERVLVDSEALNQLSNVRDAFLKIPGCFLNDDYQYSLRAFTYQNGRTTPVPFLLAQDLLAGLNANRLSIHQTGLDTAIVAKAVDKGTGLLSLLEFVGLPARDIFAIGDSEPDLAMFRVANGSFAPGNVTCRKEAQLLGCYIANASYQPGLLEIAKRISHPDGGTCDRCRTIDAHRPKDKDLFISLLEAADEKPGSLLMKNFRPMSFLAPFRK